MIQLLSEKQEGLRELCRAYGVRRLEVFGSAATDDCFDGKTSDLDFLVEFKAGYQLGPWLKNYFDLKSALERLFQRPVDLVIASALKHPLLIREVNRTRALLYAA
ncbi:MAG: nucleotidyltransferase domain-containing protein [Deltaproteobacteria bacterium]|nr:nucleotidyltransferase domain-containing protein [Deltaproteobacteria bacterium]